MSVVRIPERVILVRGQRLRADVSNDVQAVTIDDGQGRSDHFQITVNNSHGRWTDLDLFDEGNEVSIMMGYRGGPSLLFEGFVIAPGGSWPESGNPVLTVEGYDLGYKLGRNVKNRAWANVSDADIAKAIASEAGMQSAVQSTPITHEQIMQEGVSDLAFLFERAEELNYDVWVDRKTLHFGKRSRGTDIELRWRHNIQSITNLRKSIADVSTAVVVKGWDPVRKFELVGQSDVEQTDDPASLLEEVGAKITAKVMGKVQTFTSRQIPTSQAEAQAIAEAKFSNLASSYVEGSLEAEGDPRLRRGVAFRLAGVGKRFEGEYLITDSRHTIGNDGYRTSISFSNQRVTGAS